MATPNPLENAATASPVSEKTFHIAGILTTVYGLEELSTSCTAISCLWLLHPRLKTKKTMENVAASCIQEWNQQSGSNRTVGLIAVAFDQRNHGSREVNALANKSWRGGNETHAQDMFRSDIMNSNPSCLKSADKRQYISWNGYGYQPPDRPFTLLYLQLQGLATHWTAPRLGHFSWRSCSMAGPLCWPPSHCGCCDYWMSWLHA